MAGLFAIALVSAAAAAAASISGTARVIDGDSLRVGQHEIRLFGIDAPELTQTCTRAGQPWACGSAATAQLSRLVTGKQVVCLSVGTDKYGRTLARCRAGATDLNRVMVASGYALAFRRYSFEYVSAEDSAKASRRGIWSSTFELPSDIRRANERPGDDPRFDGPLSEERPVAPSSRATPRPSGNCRIKGNHSRRGERIYHLPGMPYYAEATAEEMFCTEAEARAAGYRRSRADLDH